MQTASTDSKTEKKERKRERNKEKINKERLRQRLCQAVQQRYNGVDDKKRGIWRSLDRWKAVDHA